MKNGEYIMVIAPDDYPYKKYRGRYCYEHVLTYWVNKGEIPDGYIVHHKNENKHDNRIENLALMSISDHVSHHSSSRGVKMAKIKCPYCGNIFSKKLRNTFLQKPESFTTCCSRKCSGKFSHVKLSKEERISIGLNSVLETYHHYPEP